MCPNYRLIVGERDTWTIPFVIEHHVPIEGETFVFTIRRVIDTPRMGRPSIKGDVVFQQEVSGSGLVPIVDEEGDTIGCKFFIHAAKEDTLRIPKGLNSYDLAVVHAGLKSEIELVPPSDFIVGEVLR